MEFGYKEFERLSDEEQTQIKSGEYEQTDTFTEEEIGIIEELIKHGTVVNIPQSTLYRIIDKLSYIKKEKEIISDFGKTIELKEDGDEIVLLINGKEVTRLDSKAADKVVSNGFQNSKFVKVTGIIKKETYERMKEVKDRVKKVLAAGIAIITLPLVVLLSQCSKTPPHTTEPEINPPGITMEEDIDPTPEPVKPDLDEPDPIVDIDSTQIINLIENSLNGVSSICRDIEDHKTSYEEDLIVLGKGTYDWQSTNELVTRGKNFITVVQNYKNKVSTIQKYDEKTLDEVMVELDQILNEYLELLEIGKYYCSAHIETTQQRIDNNLERNIDLSNELIINQSNLEDMKKNEETVSKTLESIQDIKQIFSDLQSGAITITENGSIYVVESNEVFANLGEYLMAQNTKGITK